VGRGLHPRGGAGRGRHPARPRRAPRPADPHGARGGPRAGVVHATSSPRTSSSRTGAGEDRGLRGRARGRPLRGRGRTRGSSSDPGLHGPEQAWPCPRTPGRPLRARGDPVPHALRRSTLPAVAAARGAPPADRGPAPRRRPPRRAAEVLVGCVRGRWPRSRRPLPQRRRDAAVLESPWSSWTARRRRRRREPRVRTVLVVDADPATRRRPSPSWSGPPPRLAAADAHQALATLGSQRSTCW